MNAQPAIATQADERDERRRMAQDKLVALLKSYPNHTPPEHILFGYGGVKVHFSDLLDLFGMAR